MLKKYSDEQVLVAETFREVREHFNGFQTAIDLLNDFLLELEDQNVNLNKKEKGS